MRAAPLLAVLALVGCSADGCSVFHAQGHRTSRQSRPSGNLPLVPGGGGGGGLGALANTKSFFTFESNECADTNTDIAWAGTKITKSFWIKQQVCQSGGTVWIFAKYGGEQEYGAQIRNDPCDIRFYVNAATNTVVTSETINENDWNHIVWVYDGTQTDDADEFKVYVNGVHDTGATYLGSIPDTWENGTADMFLQNFSNCANGLNDGAIDEVDIWIGEAFTDDEVTELYNSGTPGDVSTHSKGASDHCWRMGDLFSGGQIRDECGSAHATITNATEADNIRLDVPPAYNVKSTVLDNVDESLYRADEEALECDTENKFTFCAWVKAQSTTGVDTIAARFAVNQVTWRMEIKSDNTVDFFIADSLTDAGLNYNDSTAAITDNTWHHVCGVYDGSQGTSADRAKIYVDAVDVTNVETGSIPATLTNSTSDFVIGDQSRGGVNPFHGYIDEVYFSCESLSAANISTVYNTGIPKDSSGEFSDLRIYLRMGDGTDSETTFVNSGSAGNFTGDNLEAADLDSHSAPRAP